MSFTPSDGEPAAVRLLVSYKIEYRGGIIKLPQGTANPELLDAVDYLVEEWDYALEWVPQESGTPKD